MFSDLYNRAASLLSPARRREQALRADREREAESVKLVKRGYEAARRDRRSARWNPPNRSADLELLSDSSLMRARARDLVRNNSYAQGILRARKRNIIGCGIRPQARIFDGAGNPLEKLNKQVEVLWDRWQKSADVTGRLSFYEIQRLAFQECDEAGEVLLQFVTSNDRSRKMPLALELIEADRLADDYLFPRGVNPTTNNEVRRGVEIDAVGQQVAFWIYPRSPADLNTLHTQPKRIPAANILHLFRQERVGQTRGVSLFAPVVRRLRDTEFYLENELTASAVAACYAVAITTLDGEAAGGLADSSDADGNDSDGNRFEYLQPGVVTRLMPGEDITQINPNRPNGSAEPWLALMLRSMATATGLSYEQLSRDYSQTNFSSNRASDLEGRREFRPEQDWLIRALCEPVWLRFIESAVVEEQLPGITALDFLGEFDRFTSHVWQAPGWDWVDPVKEATASIVAIKNNLSTLSDELAKRGKDLRAVLEQRKRENEMMKEFGLTEQGDMTRLFVGIENEQQDRGDQPKGSRGENADDDVETITRTLMRELTDAE